MKLKILILNFLIVSLCSLKMSFTYNEEDYNKIKDRGFFTLSLDLSYSNLSFSNLRCEDLFCINLYSANLHYTDLCYAALHYANLRYANLRSAKLRGANLTSANLNDSNLKYANLENADLTDAKLQNAIFRETNFENTIVVNADFKGAQGLLNAQKAYLRTNGALNVPEDSNPEELVKDPEELFVEFLGELISGGYELTKNTIITISELSIKGCSLSKKLIIKIFESCRAQNIE